MNGGGTIPSKKPQVKLFISETDKDDYVNLAKQEGTSVSKLVQDIATPIIRRKISEDVIVKLNTRTFDICNDNIKCDDCMDRATDFLITGRNERQQYRKGKCLQCPYNKR